MEEAGAYAARPVSNQLGCPRLPPPWRALFRATPYMNYKLAFPTYRNRFRFVREGLTGYYADQKAALALNLGTGEGDYDHMIAPFCERLISCDINEADIAFAKDLNKELTNTSYQIEDALALSFPDNHFDLITSVDVLEHVGRPSQMIKEIGRVLKPGGRAFLTFPQLYFPVTYDPVNRILSYVTNSKLTQGAYAFGHEYLITREAFIKWAEQEGLTVVREKNLSGYLVGLTEMYWPGLLQRIFKANATNLQSAGAKSRALRPSTKEPLIVKATDVLIDVDHSLFGKSKYSVGKGFVVEKK